ncbi:hypothetical protein CerSpe_132230 [Prunus speciosa]
MQKEGEGRYLTGGQFDITISQCSPVQVNKSEGESDQHLETVKCFAEGENTQVGCSAQVESKNSSSGISEGVSFLASLSDSKVDKQETCVSENSQGDESNQAEMEILDKEDQLLRGKEFGVVEETGSKEKEVVEEIDKKAEQHIESHGIANDLDEHVQVISDQQDSINENPQCVEKEAKSSHEDVKGRQMADEIADSSSEQVSVLLEERSVQEDEAAVRTLDLMNNSFKKDIKPETSIDENTDNTSSTNTIFQEEFEEETGIKGLKNKAPEKSFDAVYEDKGPEATVFNNDKSTDDDSSSTIVAGPDIPNDEATLEAKECAEDKLQKKSITDDHEEKVGLEVGEKENEAPAIPDTPLITQTEETHLPEVGNPDIFEVYPEIGSEDIIKESPKEPEYQNKFLEKTPEAGDTASETVKDDESSERHFGSPCMKHEGNTQRKGEELDVGEAKAGEEEDNQGFAAVGPIQETEQSNMTSAEHEGETETNLVEQIQSANYDIDRPLNLNSEENDTETLRENTKTITTDEAERQVINLEQSFRKEGEEDTAIPSYEITEDEIPEEKVLKEPEISGGGESTTWELNKNIEIPENILNTSTVKCEEGEQGEGKNTAPTKATEEDHRDEDPFTVEVAEEDHDYNSAISVTETSAKVTSNDEEDAPQALQKYEPGGELQNVLDVMPEEIKTETSGESVEVITCKKEERTIQNSQESSDKEKKEDIESTNNTEENDTAVVEACTEAADLSTIIEEKNLEEQEIQKLSSALVVEETTKEISEEEEIYGVILKEERKEAHAKCNEPAEGANLTQDLKSETTEDRTETDKDFYSPISEGETHAEESKKTFAPNNSFLSDVPETEIEKHFQVNDVPTVSNFDSLSGIVSQVTGLEEAETENQEQVKKNDIAPEEKVLPTIFTSETAWATEMIDVQEEENFNSKEKLENQIPTTADKPETCLKEAEAENKEHVQNIDPEEKGAETILTDKTALDIEDIAVQAGENLNSKENLEEQIPTAADEGETFWKEAEPENKEEIKHADIAFEEKGLEIILTDETALNIEDINVQAEENLNSKDNLDKQIPTSADEGEAFSNEAEAENKEEIKHTDIAPEEKGLETILTDETALDIEDIYVQAEENFNSKENLEEQIPTAADEGETFWKEVEAENKEVIKHTDIASEEKGLETILTDETALDIEDINVQAEENLNSKDNLEEQIPTSADEGETFSNEAEAGNKEGIKHTDIAPDEKGLETILTDETALDIEDIYVQAEENFNSKDNLEEQIPTRADEHETCLKEAQAENTEQVKNTDIIPEEKGSVTILTDGTSLDIEDIYVQAEETFNANENLEEQIPKAADEGETFLKEAEAENEEQAKNIDIAHEEKGLPTILTDETALDIEDNDVQAEENFNFKENLGKEIQTIADERETCLKEAEAENQEQVKTTDIVPEEKGLATILTDETSLDVEDFDVQTEQNFKSKENLDEQIPTAANEGETCLKEAESENKEQTKDINIAPEEKGLATILTDETASEIEDSDVQAEENFSPKENLEKQIPTAADEVETCLKEAKAENKEQVKDTDIVHEEKGLATVLTDDTSLDVEDIDVQAEQNFNSKENLEEQIPTAADEDKTCFKDAEIENKEQTKITDIAPEEKGLATISTVETALDIEDIDVKAEDNFNSKEILEKQIPTAANEGETCLKEAESENKERTKDINIAPEEKGLATILTDEMASEIEDSDVQAEENFNSKENLEKQIPTAADEVETCLKEAKAENKERVKGTDIVYEEKGLVTVLIDETSLDVEDFDVQAEQNFNSKENLEEQIPTAADEDKTCFKDAETENKEQTKTTDIAPDEKGPATISTVETALDIEDIDVKAEENFNSTEILEKQITTAADEGETGLKDAKAEKNKKVKNDIAPDKKVPATILTDETSLDVEDIDVQAEKNFNSKENLDEHIPTAADEDETCLEEAKEEKENLEEQIPTAADEDKTCFKDAETENKEQAKTTDIAPEEKGLEIISTVETALDIEDIDVKAEENFNSTEILEKQITTAADEGETCLKDDEAEKNEQVKNDIAPKEKVPATILTDETSLDVEHIDVQAEQHFNSKENLEEHIPTAADEDETCLKEAKEEKENLEEQIPTAADEDKTCFKDAETENKEQTKTTDIAPEEKGLATISTVETALDIEDIDVKAEENFNSKEILEKQITTAADEGETGLKDAEAEKNEQVKNDIAPEEKVPATILTDETSLGVEDIDVQAEQNFNSNENLEEHIPTAADEDETCLKEAKEEKENLEEQIPTAADEDKTCFKDAETENKEQTKTTDISPKEKGLAAISTDETALDIEDIDVKAGEIFNSKEILEKQITTAADEGETGLKDAEAENHEQVKIGIAPEEKGLATIFTDETASEIEDSDVQAEESFNLKENLEKQIPTAADDGETGLKDSESEHNEQLKNDIAPEEKVLATVLTDEAEGNFDSTEFLENQIPTETGKTTEQSFQVQSLEEAEPKLGVEDESYESEDHPEKNNMIVEEVFDEPKITGRDLNREEILEGNVTFSPESIEEDRVNNSQEIEKEIKNLKEEGSSVESMKEGIGDDLSPEYIPEDESEKFKEDKMDAVESKGEILEESHNAGIGESTVSETNKIAGEILNTLPVKYEEGQQGEGNIPASAKASKEEYPIEDTFPVKLAEVEDDDISTVAVIETSAKVIGEEGSPRAVQKYEPGEGVQKLLDVMPEETKAESSRENAQVITCTKEEREIQNIKESKEEDTNAINDKKEKDTGSEEVLEINSREQETGEHALQEIHPQEFNDKETTEDNSTEYQACIEAADLSTKIVQGNLEEQANRELSSSLVGDSTIKESSEEEENHVSNLNEEKKEAHEECKEPIEVTNMIEEETNSETFEDKRKPNEDLYTPISEEETHAEESNCFQSEVSEKDGSTVINSDSVSGIVRHQTVLKEAEAENKEQVENTDTALDEKGLATILTDGTTLDIEGIDEQSDENSNSKEFLENQIPTVAVADEGEEKVGLGNINLDDAPVKTVEQSFQVQSLEEAEPTLRVEDENNNMIAEEVKPQLLDQVFDEPKNIEGDFNEGQIIESNAAVFSPELIQEETVKNSQDNDQKKEKLKEEGSSIENIKELNANDLQLESIPEDGSEKFKDDKQEAVKFKGEILQELHAAGVGEGTTCETSKIAERSEEILYTSPVKYEEGPPGEGKSPTSAKASNEEDKDEETFSVKVAEDDDSNNDAVTVTEISEKVTSNEEEDSAESLEKYELGEEVQVKSSDLAYENKVYNLEVKASFAESIAEETRLQNEGHKEVLDLASEKLDVDATEEEIREGSEKNNMIVEEVFDEPKITDRDLNREEILEGNVTFSPESIEEDRVNNSQEIEKEIKNFKEEGSSVESMKEGNGDDLSPEYIPEDESEKFKEDKMDAVESKGEILEESHTAAIGESTVSETDKIAEEILNTLPVKYKEGQQGEGNIPASAKASKEEDPIEDTFPVKLAEVEDDDISTVAVIETSEKVIGEEGSPRAVQKYEPGEGLQKFLDVMPEETKAESSRENAQVITCTKEERAIQNIKESKEEDTNAINDTKEKDTGSEEVLEINSREQETGEHALQEIHPQEFNDKETTEDNSTEYQACIEAADLSTKIVQGNLEEQANRELSSSLVGDSTIKESSEEEENHVSNLNEEKKEAHEECKEPIEVTNMIEEETNSETFEDKRKPNEDLYTPISEEETHAEESNCFQSEVSEKDGSTVINSDSVSGIVRHQTVLKEAEAENKEQVENTDTALDEKGLATILTDGTTLDVEGIDEQSDENSNSEEFLENQISTVAVADEGEEKVGLGNINLDDAPVKTVEQSFQVQSLEEAVPTLRVEDENNNMIAEEVKPQLLDHVFDEPKNIEGDFNEGQIIESNAAVFSPELIQEETVKNSQDNDQETEKLKEEGSSIENIKELNANDLQLESIPEDGSEKFKDDKQEAVKFKGEILQELHAAGVGEGTTCETSKIAERSEEILYTSPVKYEEGPPGEGNSPTSAKASNEEDKDEETFSVKVAEDDDSNNDAVTVTEISEKVTSNEEEDSAESLEKYELGEEVQVKTSDLAYENKVYNLEVKASFAESTAEEETRLQNEGHKEVSEKLDVDATEEEIREGSEIVLKSDSQSIDVVSKDDIIACQALHEGISKEQLQIPSSTLLPEEKELKANQHEHETTTQDKNIEEEHTHEREVPADENTGDLFAARSVEEAHLQKEEPRELKASELSLEKLDAGESEEEIKESFETVSKSDCVSIDAVSKDEIIADQTLLEGITDLQLQIPSHSLLPKEEELKTYEHKHGTTTQGKSIEEEHAKKIEMPADENGGDLFAARSVEETILHKEEPRELKVSEWAPEELNADETEEEIKETFETVSKADSQSTDVVSKDEIIAYQIVHEGISKEQLQIPSSILLHEEKEIKASEDEHGTTSEEICPQREEPKDVKVSEMALKTLDADETAEETKETCETANKFASQSIDVVTEDEVVDEHTLCKVILKETPSTALLTGETKHATITTTEEENLSNVQIQDDENGNATSTAKEKSLPKEEPSELKVSDVELYFNEEIQKESSNEVHEEEQSSLIGVPKVEPHEDEEGERYDDSPLGNQKTTELKGTTMEATNLDIETSEKASDCAPEGGFSRSEDTTINREHLKNEANETIKNEVSNEQKHLEVAISDSRAEERWCETTIEANETRKNEVSNEEIEAEKLGAKDLRPISVSGENISHREQENELIAEKYEGEKSETFNTARNENRDSEESPKETTQVAKHLTEDKELQTEENLCDTTVEANEKIKTELSNEEIKEGKELPKDSGADSVREESHQEKKAIAEEYQVEKTNESSVIRTNENRGELPEEKDTTASKEVQTEEEEEEEHENAEEVRTFEETRESEHKNAETGYDSPVIVEASRDADAKISHKKSHNILSGIKHSISKVKKAITGKSSHSKTQSEK